MPLLWPALEALLAAMDLRAERLAWSAAALRGGADGALRALGEAARAALRVLDVLCAAPAGGSLGAEAFLLAWQPLAGAWQRLLRESALPMREAASRGRSDALAPLREYFSDGAREQEVCGACAAAGRLLARISQRLHAALGHAPPEERPRGPEPEDPLLEGLLDGAAPDGAAEGLDAVLQTGGPLWHAGGHPAVPFAAAGWDAWWAAGAAVDALGAGGGEEGVELLRRGAAALCAPEGVEAELLEALCTLAWATTAEGGAGATANLAAISGVVEALRRRVEAASRDLRGLWRASLADLSIPELDRFTDGAEEPEAAQRPEGPEEPEEPEEPKDFLPVLCYAEGRAAAPLRRLALRPLAPLLAVGQRAEQLRLVTLAERLLRACEAPGGPAGAAELAAALAEGARAFVARCLGAPARTFAGVAFLRPWQSLRWAAEAAAPEELSRVLPQLLPRLGADLAAWALGPPGRPPGSARAARPPAPPSPAARCSPPASRASARCRSPPGAPPRPRPASRTCAPTRTARPRASRSSSPRTPAPSRRPAATCRRSAPSPPSRPPRCTACSAASPRPAAPTRPPPRACSGPAPRRWTRCRRRPAARGSSPRGSPGARGRLRGARRPAARRGGVPRGDGRRSAPLPAALGRARGRGRGLRRRRGARAAPPRRGGRGGRGVGRREERAARRRGRLAAAPAGAPRDAAARAGPRRRPRRRAAPAAPRGAAGLRRAAAAASVMRWHCALAGEEPGAPEEAAEEASARLEREAERLERLAAERPAQQPAKDGFAALYGDVNGWCRGRGAAEAVLRLLGAEEGARRTWEGAARAFCAALRARYEPAFEDVTVPLRGAVELTAVALRCLEHARAAAARGAAGAPAVGLVRCLLRGCGALDGGVAESAAPLVCPQRLGSLHALLRGTARRRPRATPPSTGRSSTSRRWPSRAASSPCAASSAAAPRRRAMGR